MCSFQESGVVEVTVAGSLATFDVEMHSNLPVDGVQWHGNGTSVHSPFPAKVLMYKELHTPESERSCLHVELDISGSQVPPAISSLRVFNM